MIGLYGGSFDPIHIGHLRLAEDVREYYKLNKVIFIPAYLSPLKHRINISPEDRLKLVKMAIDYNPYFDIDDREIKNEKVSYTVNTILFYKRKLGYNPIFLVGSDAFLSLHKWKKYNLLLEITNFIVIGRDKDNLADIYEYSKKVLCKDVRLTKTIEPFSANIYFFNGRRIDISSTEIRDRIRRGKPITYLVPPIVEDYIKEKRLYVE